MSDQLAKDWFRICNDILFLQLYCEYAAILPHKPHFQTEFEKLEYRPLWHNPIKFTKDKRL